MIHFPAGFTAASRLHARAITGAVALAIALGLASSLGAAKTQRPNIVFILIDDMGYADLGCYGATDIRTPNIDRIAREGVKLDNFYANAPVCTPTRCAFITGRWQQRTGMEFAMGFAGEQVRKVNGAWVKEPDMNALGLPPTAPSIARLLKTAGYATACFGKWHLGYKDKYNPLNFGFDEYFGTLLGHADYYRHAYYDGTYELRDGMEIVHRPGRYVTDMINERATDFIRKHAREPFFLYVPHLAQHAPWQAPDHPDTPMVTRQSMYHGTRADYAAMLERVDLGVGMILAELERQGLARNTLVVLSSDNGGERLSDNRPLFHHKATLWEGGIRVPCVLRWPEVLPAGRTIHQMGITMDLTATFLAAAGVRLPADYHPDGMDILPMLSGKAPESERTFFWRIDRSNRKQWAARKGKWKYLNDGNSMDLLFNLETDLGERRNLYYEHPEIVSDLKARLKVWQDEMDASDRDLIIR
ncbi:MAG: sulfatase [Opitutaceae bacterium]|nr:sulfatase [Opitutaceae bacterium]